MAAALRVQYGSGWVTHVWRSLFYIASDIVGIHDAQIKLKHFMDSARKDTLKHKKQLLNKCYSRPDSSYGDTTVHPVLSWINSARIIRIACKEVKQSNSELQW